MRLRPTEYLQSDDPKIQELARAAVGNATDAGKAVKQIEAFVEGYIKTRDFSIGYASALQVAESRQRRLQRTCGSDGRSVPSRRNSRTRCQRAGLY